MEEELEAEPGAARGLAAGFLAALPLFVLYECTWREVGLSNAAELLLTLPLRPLGSWVAPLRILGLVLATVAALVHVLRAGQPDFRGLVRCALFGAASGVLLGPLLILLGQVLGPDAPDLAPAATGPVVQPGAALVLFHAGSAAWEELLFRVLVYGLVYLLARRTVLFLGGAETPADWVGEVTALVLSSLGFAAFHLGVFTGWLGAGGGEFQPGIFLWQTLAGVVLGLLMRWRGFGVAAWAHAVFNLGLALGAGPAVFL